VNEPVLGLDIGGTKLAAGVVDPTGAVRSFAIVASDANRGPAAVLATLFDLGRKVVADAGLAPENLAATGIACGGPLDPAAGVVIDPPHLPGWRDVPVTALAEHELGAPAVLDNDATAAAVGEHRFGVGRDVSNLVYLTISTGIGGGLILRGRPYRGSTGNAGELGHVTVDRFGRRCRGCGRRGCLEAYASGTSIAERAAEAIADPGVRSTLTGLDRPTAADVSAAARQGDPLAVRLWRETTDVLVCGLSSLVNVYEPDLVVLGGGVTEAGDLLLDPVRQGVRAEAMGPRPPRLELTAAGSRVGVLGAAAVAYDQLRSIGNAYSTV
jgi:glucokinase